MPIHHFSLSDSFFRENYIFVPPDGPRLGLQNHVCSHQWLPLPLLLPLLSSPFLLWLLMARNGGGRGEEKEEGRRRRREEEEEEEEEGTGVWFQPPPTFFSSETCEYS